MEPHTYGTVAVHVTGVSPNGAVLNLTIDGGPDSKQAQTFPELSDGVAHTVPEMLTKRPARKTAPKKALPTPVTFKDPEPVPAPTKLTGAAVRKTARRKTGQVKGTAVTTF